MAESSPNWTQVFSNQDFIKSYKIGERVTAIFAQLLVDQSALVADSKSHQEQPLVILDNACGTGIISSILQHDVDDEVKAKWQLTSADLSEGMLEYTRRRMETEGWVNTEVKQVDAQDTKLPSNHYSHVFTAFAFMALPLGLAALDESTRILQPGGTIAFTTWIQPGWVSVSAKAIATIADDLPWPTTKEFLGVTGNGEWDSVEWIESELKNRNFCDINVNSVTRNNFLTVSNFVDMAMFMFPVVMEMFWSEKMRQANKEKVRPALEKYLVDTYGEDGQVPGEWVAIVSTARKSGA